MDIRPITPRYAVSPQIAPQDLPAIREAGFTTVICNRPDAENPEDLQADAMRAAAEAEGLAFVVHPLTHQTMTPENVSIQMQAVETSAGPVLAYCASGTRSTIAWALGQAGEMDSDAIIEAARQGGYDLENMRPMLGQSYT